MLDEVDVETSWADLIWDRIEAIRFAPALLARPQLATCGPHVRWSRCLGWPERSGCARLEAMASAECASVRGTTTSTTCRFPTVRHSGSLAPCLVLPKWVRLFELAGRPCRDRSPAAGGVQSFSSLSCSRAKSTAMPQSLRELVEAVMRTRQRWCNDLMSIDHSAQSLLKPFELLENGSSHEQSVRCQVTRPFLRRKLWMQHAHEQDIAILSSVRFQASCTKVSSKNSVLPLCQTGLDSTHAHAAISRRNVEREVHPKVAVLPATMGQQMHARFHQREVGRGGEVLGRTVR